MFSFHWESRGSCLQNGTFQEIGNSDLIWFLKNIQVTREKSSAIFPTLEISKWDFYLFPWYLNSKAWGYPNCCRIHLFHTTISGVNFKSTLPHHEEKLFVPDSLTKFWSSGSFNPAINMNLMLIWAVEDTWSNEQTQQSLGPSNTVTIRLLCLW